SLEQMACCQRAFWRPRREGRPMSKSWLYLAIAGVVVALLSGAGVAWSIGLWTWQESPPLRATPPTTPATALLADPVPPEGRALPVPQNEEKDKVIRRISLSVGNGWWLDLSSDGTTRLGYGAADTWLVKPKTFDFAATLKALRAVARKEGLAGGRHYLVA